ncbi:hypothetical protein SGQ83_21505 [Flavobacterium sp. Fl-318]|uniref:DUF2254 domain-containing protein n=1 Tax=Flavobacterium cupriresistens TaxID=2893885 RepID=A0ABU4RKQ7_9FLAO|nr:MULTISPECIES: hypothetical protein [unclassified Flavobacterium]MDX6191940.1 hypothetical protein [Flavobacterium sp. Fl-318]UFH44579.1 hypothetical protein LNP23_10305 [Flavobacterium sp. F-323]
MKFIRYSNIWLLHRSEKQIRRQHNELYLSFFKHHCKACINHFCDRNNWFSVFLLVLIFFAFSSFPNLEILNFLDFNSVLAKTVVDQRTTNIAAIISMSLVVVGFLITNLALKSPTTIKLLFKKSRLYFTLYLTFSTISCFIMLSTFRETLNDFVFTRAVLAGTYLCIIILLLIGYLFRKIIHFTDDKHISEMLKKELLDEAKEKLKLQLLKKYSREIYTRFASRRCTQYEFQVSLPLLLSQNFTVAPANDEAEEKEDFRELKNVNLLLLKLYIHLQKKKQQSTISFKSMTLNETFNYNEDLLWVNDRKNGWWSKWFLKFCLLTAPNPAKKTALNTYRNEFDKTILESAQESRHGKLEVTLAAYLDLYKLKMHHQN